MKKSLSKFVFLWLSQSVSVFGSELSAFAAKSWLVQVGYPRPEDRHLLGAMIAVLMVAIAIPRIVVAPIAGAWADRMDRRHLMIAVNVGSAATTAILSSLAITGRLEVIGLIALLAMTSVLATFHTAAFQASYVMIVPEAQLGRASGLMQTAKALCNVLAPLLGALLIGLPSLLRTHGTSFPSSSPFIESLLGGWGLGFALDALSFVFAAGALFFIAIPSPRTSSAPSTRVAPSLWEDMGSGLRFVRARPALLWLLGLCVVGNLLTAPEAVLIPLLVQWNLSADLAAHGLTFDQGYATICAAASAGGILGGILITSWGGLKRRRIDGVLVPLAVIGLFQAGFGLAPALGIAALMAFARELLMPTLYAHEHTIWQTVTPAELQGRVFAVRNASQAASAMLALALSGLIAGWVNPGWLFAGTGVVLLGVMAAQFGSSHRLALDLPSNSILCKTETAGGST